MKSESLSLIWNCLKKRHAGSWLSRLPWTRNGNWCRYADWRPKLYHQIKWVSSLVAVPSDLPLLPATNQVRSFSSIQMFNVSHTSTHIHTYTHAYTTQQKDNLTEQENFGANPLSHSMCGFSSNYVAPCELLLCWNVQLEHIRAAFSPFCVSSSNSRVRLPCSSVGHQQVSHKSSAGKLAPRAPELSLHRRVQKRKTSKMCNTRATPCERKRCLIQAAAAVMPDLTASWAAAKCNSTECKIQDLKVLNFRRKYWKWADRPSIR